MYKIIVSHLFAALILVGVWRYESGTNELIIATLMSLITLEIGFLSYHTKKNMYRLFISPIWFILYCNALNSFINLIVIAWKRSDNLTSSLTNLVIFLGVVVFTLTAIILSFQLIFKTLRIEKIFRIFLLACMILISSVAIFLEQTDSLNWDMFLQEPLTFMNQIIMTLSHVNILFIIGLCLIQMMVIVLLASE